ncbi:MAG: NifB/NifX family molybdenum-iron cluster-binding protein [bacterium]
MKFAIPLADGVLCMHFGHCQQFALLAVDGNKVVGKELVTPPPHEPGVLPQWLHGLGVKIVIAGGMGQRAVQFFNEYGIQVVTGAPALTPDRLVEQYLEQSLETGPNVCDH